MRSVERRKNPKPVFGLPNVVIEGGYNFDPLRGGVERRKDSPLYEDPAEDETKDVSGPGIVPLEFKVLVRPEDAGVDPLLARAKAAGLKLPEDVLAREFMAQIVAEFVSAGGNAFEDWKDKRLPQPGDKVLMAKYAGITVRGADGVEYRMLNDKDISALITAEGVSRV